MRHSSLALRGRTKIAPRGVTRAGRPDANSFGACRAALTRNEARPRSNYYFPFSDRSFYSGARSGLLNERLRFRCRSTWARRVIGRGRPACDRQGASFGRPRAVSRVKSFLKARAVRRSAFSSSASSRAITVITLAPTVTKRKDEPIYIYINIHRSSSRRMLFLIRFTVPSPKSRRDRSIAPSLSIP